MEVVANAVEGKGEGLERENCLKGEGN